MYDFIFLPQIQLYVDGKMFVPDEDNMEVLDDWPLHPTDRVHFTKLSIGACWRGRNLSRIFFFYISAHIFIVFFLSILTP